MIKLLKLFHKLEFTHDCYKTKKVCNKAVYTCFSAIQFISECYKTQRTCDEAVDAVILYMILYRSTLDSRNV